MKQDVVAGQSKYRDRHSGEACGVERGSYRMCWAEERLGVAGGGTAGNRQLECNPNMKLLVDFK